jgi:hypothetical protein
VKVARIKTNTAIKRSQKSCRLAVRKLIEGKRTYYFNVTDKRFKHQVLNGNAVYLLKFSVVMFIYSV